jgi:putative transposase
MDNLHQLSRRLINENQVICVENLAVKNLIKNPKLAKHIADASGGEFTHENAGTVNKKRAFKARDDAPF